MALQGLCQIKLFYFSPLVTPIICFSLTNSFLAACSSSRSYPGPKKDKGSLTLGVCNESYQIHLNRVPSLQALSPPGRLRHWLRKFWEQFCQWAHRQCSEKMLSRLKTTVSLNEKRLEKQRGYFLLCVLLKLKHGLDNPTVKMDCNILPKAGLQM